MAPDVNTAELNASAAAAAAMDGSHSTTVSADSGHGTGGATPVTGDLGSAGSPATGTGTAAGDGGVPSLAPGVEVSKRGKMAVARFCSFDGKCRTRSCARGV